MEAREFKPRFKHECDQCTFLGEYRYLALFEHGRRTLDVDLHLCRKKPDGIVVRYGDRNDQVRGESIEFFVRLAGGVENTFSPAIIEGIKRAATLRLIDVLPTQLLHPLILYPYLLHPPPLDFSPTLFLERMAKDALDRAERLETRAGLSLGDADDARATAQRYRVRAEAYTIASNEMTLAMGKV